MFLSYDDVNHFVDTNKMMIYKGDDLHLLSINFDIKKENLDINLDIQLGNDCVDGGIYMFLIDDIPLYIGESNIFLGRLTYHLQQLQHPVNGASYFGLGTLTGKHQITYMILAHGFPYIQEKKECNKYSTDKNSMKRKNIEWECIQTYRPLIQRPNFIEDAEINTIRSKHQIRKKDDVLPKDYRNQFVMDCFEQHLKGYDNIKELINQKYKSNLL